MIENVLPRDQLRSFAKQQFRPAMLKTVKKSALPDALNDGWTIQRKHKLSVRVQKPKRKSELLECRVWALLYRMGFMYLSGPGGAKLRLATGGSDAPINQLDGVAVDDDVAIYVECKSSEQPKKDPRFDEKLAKLVGMKRRFANAVALALPTDTKRHVAPVMATWDLVLTDNDRKRAEEDGITLLDELDLEYFEALVKHLGPAARYQLLGEVFRGKEISGLEIRVPALQTRMGRLTCYTFSVRPDYLLKIAYVAHRAKGKAIDIDAYQRMISKSRLKQIAEYISADGTFPTNIVINIEDPRHARFEQGKQEGDASGATWGWLRLSPAYGSAWIIDGQHRLFAYSGHDRAHTSFLNVLAFDGLSPSKQAQLFVDINSEQRRVKRSLLVELDADLKWEDEDENKRIDAIISKAGMALDEHADSPLHDLVLLADMKRTDSRCISLTAIANALDKPGFFIVQKKKGITEYGFLWRDNATDALKRTVYVLKEWFRWIADAASDWWQIGAGPGGGLAMNNGVTVCINVLRSVCKHLGESKLVMQDNEDVVERLRPYGDALGGYFARMPPEERVGFRQLQGVDGQTTGTRMCEEALQVTFPTFDPPGLSDWIARKEAQTNDQARQMIEYIERTLQDVLLTTLKEEFQQDANEWWFEGVPKSVRLKVDDRINQSDGKAGTREQNFDLIHYRDIIEANWKLFGDTFGYGAKGNKQEKTKWLADVAAMRNVVMHPSRREFLSFQKLNELHGYEDWLRKRVVEFEEEGSA